jgi:hypothetical protein
LAASTEIAGAGKSPTFLGLRKCSRNSGVCNCGTLAVPPLWREKDECNPVRRTIRQTCPSSAGVRPNGP